MKYQDFQSKMNDYTLIKRLGFGRFGTAHLAKKKDDDMVVVAKENRSKIFNRKIVRIRNERISF